MKSRNPSLTASFMRWFPLVILPSGVMILYKFLQPWAFMWSLAFSIYFGLKWFTWRTAQKRISHPAWRSVAYILAWPGMDADSFLHANSPVPVPRLRNWIWAVIETGLGVILIWAVAPSLPEGHPLLRGWAGMLGLILVLHFGMFQIAALFWQSLGVNAPPIMSAPLRSESLAEFWGKRWNLGFRQLAHDLLFAPLHKKLGGGVTSFSIFVV